MNRLYFHYMLLLHFSDGCSSAGLGPRAPLFLSPIQEYVTGGTDLSERISDSLLVRLRP